MADQHQEHLSVIILQAVGAPHKHVPQKPIDGCDDFKSGAELNFGLHILDDQHCTSTKSC